MGIREGRELCRADAKSPRNARFRAILRLLAELVPHGCQHAVAQRHQCRSEPFILGDKPGRLANRDHLGVARPGITGPTAQRRPVHDDDPAGSQQPHPLGDVIWLVDRVASMNTRS